MKRVRGYPGVSEAHLAVALNYSNTHLLGPPVCRELISLVEHMYTEEEAEIVQHVKPMRVRTAVAISGKSGRPYDEVKGVLDRLAHERHVILSFGKGDRERYLILPLVPGTFEMTLMRPDPDTVTDWNRRFASLFEELFSTGYITEYMKKPTDSVRYLPVGEVIPSLRRPSPRTGWRSYWTGTTTSVSRPASAASCRRLTAMTAAGCSRSARWSANMSPL